MYGHRTKDGSMFEGLMEYEDPEFYEEHKTFTLDTLYEPELFILPMKI